MNDPKDRSTKKADDAQTIIANEVNELDPLNLAIRRVYTSLLFAGSWAFFAYGLYLISQGSPWLFLLSGIILAVFAAFITNFTEKTIRS